MTIQKRALSLILAFAVFLSFGAAAELSTDDFELPEEQFVSMPLESEVQELQNAFEQSNEVDVIIWLKDNQFTSPEYQEDYDLKRAEIRKIQDRVLSTLDENEFHLKYRYIITNGFAGRLSRSGYRKLLQSPDVNSIYLDRVVKASLDESRALIDADDVQSLGVDGSGVDVCVLDTGIDYTHPALGGCFGPGCKVVMGYDFCNGPYCTYANDTNPMDENGHGTHVAGIVASSDSTYRGIAPGVTLGALKVMNASGEGTFGAVAAGIDFCTLYAVPFNTKVITMSLGDGNSYTVGNCPTGLSPVIQNALQAGVFVDAASGNEGYTTGISYPACALGVTSVGATYDEGSQIDQVTSFTNRGVNLDLLAPGSMITSTAFGQTFADAQGTSMAAPHVAGLAALLYVIRQNSTPSYVENVMKLTGKQIYDSGSSLFFSRVDARAAARFAANPDGWLRDRRVSFNASGSYYPDIAADQQGNLHVVWADSRDGNSDIYYIKLSPSGNNLTSEIRLTMNPASSLAPVVAVDSNGYVHVVWHDYAYGALEIFYKKLDNNGLAVSPDIRVTQTASNSLNPTLGIDSQNNVHIAWQEDNNGYDIFYKKLNNNGINLTGNIPVINNMYPHSVNPSLAIDKQDNIHVVWNEDYSNLYYAKLDSNGGMLVQPKSLGNSGLYSSFGAPILAVDSHRDLHVLISYNYVNYYPSLQYYHFNETGSSISPGYFPGAYNVYSYDVATDSQDLIHFVWSKAENPGNQGELYYAKMNQTGNLVVPSTRLTFDPANSWASSFILTNKGVHVVWEEYRDGNFEIYYKGTQNKKPTTPCKQGSIC